MSTEKESRLWVEAKKILCGEGFLGDLCEYVVGSAKECWCCSAWRFALVFGIPFGMAIATILWALVAVVVSFCL